VLPRAANFIREVEIEDVESEGSLTENDAAADRAARAARRYLHLLRDALLDEHYLENELRIEHLLECVNSGRHVDHDKLANPLRYMQRALRRLQEERQAGRPPNDGGPGSGSRSDGLAYTALGHRRLDHLEACLEVIRDESVRGDLVDCGAGRGGTAIFMRGFLEAHEVPGPKVWAADRFDATADPAANASARFSPDLNAVREAFARFGLLDDRVVFLQGPPSHTLAPATIGSVALLRVASSDPDEVQAVLAALYDRIAPGGFVVVDTYGDSACRAAVDRFRSERGVLGTLERIDWTAAAWRKVAADREGLSSSTDTRVGLDVARVTATKDLGVVVVAYNMPREAARTLHSLSRGYQRGIEDLEYEVIVVENGSQPEHRLGEELVRSFGAEFRYIDLGDDAAPSPAGAVNRGIEASSAQSLALMIDGAHVLTPGVLRFGMMGLDAYAPAIVTTKQWYVGPGQQPQTVAGGYDHEIEDRLFAQIGWPRDGYRLFDIGHFIGDRDWFDGEWESNCIFVPRALIGQAGGMDESFSAPGGGFVNLDFFERMVSTPGVTLVSILGEGSFHQVHGGTTTNLTEPDALIRSYGEQYEELRGRRFQVPPQRTHYIGALPSSARRTRARRMYSFSHFRNAHAEATEGLPSRPLPVPQDMKTEFTDAYWRSGEWHRTPWLGRWTHRPPADLFAYQELIHRVRPDWVVATRTGDGGRALFLASICDLIDHGRILSIDSFPVANPPDHPRVTHLRADPAAPRTAADVREMIGDASTALVILGGGALPQVMGAFRNFAALVAVDSYVVIEDTVLHGNPVWPAFGAGPAAAVEQIVNEGSFVPDPSLELFGPTFSPRGFLKRVR
jgi:cephalosporin hydroxylase